MGRYDEKCTLGWRRRKKSKGVGGTLTVIRIGTCGTEPIPVATRSKATARLQGFFFFFSRRYNPCWVLACFTILFHNLLSLHFSLQFLTFTFFRSSSTWSRHLSLGLPNGLDEHGSHSVSFFTVLVVSIRITCATQRNSLAGIGGWNPKESIDVGLL